MDVFQFGIVEKIPRFHQSRIWWITIQIALRITFLSSYGQCFALACPTGQLSKDDEPVRYIDSGVSKGYVYKTYQDEWTRMLDYTLSTNVCKQQAPTEPLVFRSFLNFRARSILLWACRSIAVVSPIHATTQKHISGVGPGDKEISALRQKFSPG